MQKTKLFVFSGLPASGKSTLAQFVVKKYKANYLRIDTIEQAIRDLCSFDVQGEGYRLAYKIATDNLNLQQNVVIDCCNPIELTREEWKNVALTTDSFLVNIEVLCFDIQEHKKRVAQRKVDIPNLKLPTWEEIEKYKYTPWEESRIVIDTAHKSIDESVQELIEKISSIDRQ